jgi:Uma2 family endonuclease
MTITGKRLTVDEFEELGRRGVYGEDDRVELINGEVVAMSPVGGKHVEVLNLLTRVASRQVGDEYLVQVQSPIRISTDGEPMPDLAIVRDRPYGGQLPTEADTLLVIEVSDTTLRYDRTTKLPLYAAAGIPEAWIVNLRDHRIERFAEPRDGAYRQSVVAGLGQTLASLVVPALVVEVMAVLR